MARGNGQMVGTNQKKGGGGGGVSGKEERVRYRGMIFYKPSFIVVI
jgi:hypothetical protein